MRQKDSFLTKRICLIAIVLVAIAGTTFGSTSLGLPTTDLTALKTAMEKIHPSNIDTVLYLYEETYGTDLLSDIKKEFNKILYSSNVAVCS